MQVLALDFDGVICDSAPECFCVALRTWSALEPRSSLAARGGALGSARVPALEAVRAHPLYPGFVSLMPLGNRAEDFGVALAALECGAAIADQSAWDAFAASLPEGFAGRFHERFYVERERLRALDERAWLALMAPYRDFVELLQRRAGDTAPRLAIATAKDRRSVLRLLGAFGIEALFDPRQVFDKEAGRSKRAHLRGIADRSGCPLGAITFVDDKVNHLEAVAPLGVRPLLAAWGYNGPREQQRAREHGFTVCGLAEAERQLFAHTDQATA